MEGVVVSEEPDWKKGILVKDKGEKPYHGIMKPKNVSKTQVGGDHYSKLPIQPLEYALANKLGVMEHAVVKYVTRHQDKGGKEDLDKAIDYLHKMITHYYS